MLYNYSGPVYNEDDRELDWVNISTQAPTVSKALSNIKFRLMRNRFHQRIYLDPQCLTNEDDSGLIVSYNRDEFKESVERQILLKDFDFGNLEDVLDGKSILNKVVKIDSEKLLTAYNKENFIDDNDEIIIPKGSQFTWKATRMYQGKTYDIYHLKGNNYCLIVVPTNRTLELFGDRI